MPPGQSIHILIIDPNAMIRRMLEAAFAAAGLVALEADSGAAAVAVCQANPGAIDLALIDMDLHQHSGLETMHAIHQIDPGIRCCLMTAVRFNPGQVKRWHELGALRVFPKPFPSLADLVRELRNCLESPTR